MAAEEKAVDLKERLELSMQVGQTMVESTQKQVAEAKEREADAKEREQASERRVKKLREQLQEIREARLQNFAAINRQIEEKAELGDSHGKDLQRVVARDNTPMST